MTSSWNGAVNIAEHAGRHGNTNGTFVSYCNGACSFDEYIHKDDINAGFLPSASAVNGVTPSASSNMLGSASCNNNNTDTTLKRKPPHLFKQLANELRWMHNNIKHGYHTGSTSKHQQRDSFCHLSTLQMTREDLSAPEDEELLTMCVRSSLRDPSASIFPRNQGNKFHTKRDGSGAAKRGLEKTRWRTMENGEVEAVEEPQIPQSTPDPYAPSACRYVVRHPKEAVVAANEESRSAAVNQFYSAEHPGEEVSMLDAYMSDSVLSDVDDHYDEDSWSHRQGGDKNSSTLEGVATMNTCPSDRRLAKMRYASDGILEDLDEDRTGHLSSAGTAFDDNYEGFLSGISELQRQVHWLEQQTSKLRKLYGREQTARMRAKSKGQHLSWTRTVEAANTIQFWRMKVNLLRGFESQYVSTVLQLQKEILLVDPGQESTLPAVVKTSKSSGAISPLTESRRDFLRSSRVISAQQHHLQALGEQLKACWQVNANLRDELRRFEQWEMRNPHDTFSVAGMDAEHFIASLPPRISAYTPSGASTKSSAHSFDSVDDEQAPMVLLTAQDLSPSEEDDDVDAAAPPPTMPLSPAQAAVRGKERSCRLQAISDAAPVAPCVKTAAGTANTTTTTPITMPTTPSFKVLTSSSYSSPKRLKYVIQSAVFDVDDGSAAAAGDANNNSTSGRQSNRGSNDSCSMTPLTAALPTSFYAQQRRKRERHVTFALEPEVLEARPHLSAQGRTSELLEQICMDKQVSSNGLMLLQTALDERYSELAAMQDRLDEKAEDQQEEMLLDRAVTSTPRCANPPALRGESEGREIQLRRDTAPSPTITPPPIPNSFEKKAARGKCSKVKPRECAQCSVM